MQIRHAIGCAPTSHVQFDVSSPRRDDLEASYQTLDAVFLGKTACVEEAHGTSEARRGRPHPCQVDGYGDKLYRKATFADLLKLALQIRRDGDYSIRKPVHAPSCEPRRPCLKSGSDT